MRASPMAEFSVNEYAQRMEGLVRELRARGMDGALISSRENTRYFCGLQSIIWSSKVSTPGILLVNADGAHELIGSASSVETARYTSVIDDGAHSCFNRNGLPGVPATYPQAIAAAFRKLKLERGRVGMELGEGAYLQLQLQWFEQLAGLLPGATFADASDAIFALRGIKSEAEIERMARACRQNEESLRFAFANVAPGRDTEADFFRLYAQEAFRRGCENVSYDLAPLSVVYGRARFDRAGCPCGDTRIEARPHETLVASGGLYTDGYFSNLTRVGIVGGMTERQKKYFGVASDALALARTLIRDGASVRAVSARVDDFIRAAAGPEACRWRDDLGFGVGLDLREPPLLKRLSQRDAPFRAGMTLCICPRVGDAETGLMAAAQQIVVREGGVQALSEAPEAPCIL